MSEDDYTVSDYRLCLDIVPLRGKETGVLAPAAWLLGLPPPLARKRPGEQRKCVQVTPGVGQGHNKVSVSCKAQKRNVAASFARMNRRKKGC